MNKETKERFINNIEELSRVTQDQYFIINNRSSKLNDPKSKLDAIDYHINKMFKSKLYKFFIKHFAKKFKSNMKRIRSILRE